MNVYILDPRNIEYTKIDILLSILKVGSIINLIKHIDCPENLLNKIKEQFNFDIEKIKEEDIYITTARKIISLFFSTTFEDNNIREIKIINDYGQSKGLNPLYNLERCNDCNLIIFTSGKLYQQLFDYIDNFVAEYDSIRKEYLSKVPVWFDLFSQSNVKECYNRICIVWMNNYLFYPSYIKNTRYNQNERFCRKWKKALVNRYDAESKKI